MRLLNTGVTLETQQYKLDAEQERTVQRMIANPYLYLAHEMGTGKTLVVLEYLRRTNQKALVVAPLLVAERTWPKEVEKWNLWDGKKDCVFVHGPAKDVLVKSSAQIKTINYEGLKWLYYHVQKHGSGDLSKRVLVLDESTRIRTPGTVGFKVLKAMQHLFKGVFNLSGSPLPKGYLGLWAQYYMLDRGKALGPTFGTYKSKYFYESGPPRWLVETRDWAPAQIQERIKSLTSVSLAEERPRLVREVPVALSSTSIKQYTQLKQTKTWQYGNEIKTIESSGVLINKLRQITQGGMYNLDGQSYEELHVEKINALKVLRESLSEEDPAICAINFKFELDMVRKYLGKDIPCIVGGTSSKLKNKYLDDFAANKTPLLLCHPAAMGHGLNDLQLVCNKVIWYSLPWDLEHYEQLNGRIDRRGQTRTVLIFHLIANGTVDNRLSEVLQLKDTTQETYKQIMLAATREEI